MKSIYTIQQEVVLDLERQLEEAKAKLNKLKWPLKTKLYVHGCEDSNYSDGKTLGLTEKQLEIFFRTAYEVEFDIEIDETGKATATHVNGVALEKRIDL